MPTPPDKPRVNPKRRYLGMPIVEAWLTILFIIGLLIAILWMMVSWAQDWWHAI